MWNDSHVNELMWWFDTADLARNILEQLEDAGVKPTVDNAKKLWLDFLLTELSEGLERSVEALINKNEFIAV